MPDARSSKVNPFTSLAETRAILSDPETMNAIVEAETENGTVTPELAEAAENAWHASAETAQPVRTGPWRIVESAESSWADTETRVRDQRVYMVVPPERGTYGSAGKVFGPFPHRQALSVANAMTSAYSCGFDAGAEADTDGLREELDAAVEALAGDSNDAEHDALYSLAEWAASQLGEDLDDLVRAREDEETC